MGTDRGLLEQARVFAEALFADEAGAPPAARLDWLVQELDDFLAHGGPRVELLLRGGLALATFAAPAFVGKLPPLSRLSIEDRCRALDRLEHTPAGLPLLAVKAMLCFLYYEHPDVLRQVGVTEGDETAPACRARGAEGGAA